MNKNEIVNQITPIANLFERRIKSYCSRESFEDIKNFSTKTSEIVAKKTRTGAYLIIDKIPVVSQR